MIGPKDQRGMTLLEVLIAMLITVIGIISVATLIIYGIGLQVVSRDTSAATALANAKLEELQVKPSTDPQRSIGGDLNSNIANHFDAPTGFTRRWVVASGQADTLDVTVRVITENPTVQTTPVVEMRALLEDN